MTQVFVLGAGTPTPTPDRWGSAFAVDVGGEYLMFDCGPAATAKLVKVGILPTRVDYLFFTHHHFDHDVDGGFNRSSQQSLCEPIVERHRAPRRVFASREFFAAWR